MIKVISFDLVGVLVKETNTSLPILQKKIESLLGSNKNDEDFFESVRNFCNLTNKEIENNCLDIMSKLYTVKIPPKNLQLLKTNYPAIKLVISTNNISCSQEFIEKTFGKDIFDNIFISANLGYVKPELEFFENILQTYKITPNELLFLDDYLKYTDVAKTYGINSIHVTTDTDVLNTIIKFLDTKK